MRERRARRYEPLEKFHRRNSRQAAGHEKTGDQRWNINFQRHDQRQQNQYRKRAGQKKDLRPGRPGHCRARLRESPKQINPEGDR